MTEVTHLETMDFHFIILDVPDIPQQLQELVCILFLGLLTQPQFMEFFNLVIIVPIREVLLLEIFLELFLDNISLIYLIYFPKVFPPNRRSSCQIENRYLKFHISKIILDLEIFSYSQKPSFNFLTSF